MDQEQIQDVLIVRTAAEILKDLATPSKPDEGDVVGAAANPDAVRLPKSGLLGNEASAAIIGGEFKSAVLREVSLEVVKEAAAVIAPPVDAQQAATPETAPIPKPEATEPQEKSEPLPYDDLYGRFSKTYEQSPAVLENQPAPSTSDALESGHDPQLAETPEPIAVNDSNSQKPQSLSTLPDYDLGRRFDDTHEYPIAIHYQEHQQFLAENAEAIKSLQSTPSKFWTPEQQSKAEQIRKQKEEYRNLTQDLTQGPVQGPELPPLPPPPAFGSERTIETPDLFAAQRPAAEAQRGPSVWNPGEQERLQAAADAATPADLGGAKDSVVPPERPPQTALAAIPEEYRGNLASDALSEAVQMEASQSIEAPPVWKPEDSPVEAEAMPTSIWTRMGRRARQAFAAPPQSPYLQQKQHEDALDRIRNDPSLIDPSTKQNLFFQDDDDEETATQPPPRQRQAQGAFGAGGIAAGSGGAGGSGRAMHVWVDGGQLQLVDHINSLGAVTGQHLQPGQTGPTGSPGSAPGGQDETSQTFLSFLGIGGGAVGPAATIAAATYAGNRADQAIRGGIHSAAENASPFIGQTQSGIAGGMAEAGYDLASGSAGNMNALMPQNLLATMASLPKHVTNWTEALLHSTEGLRQFSGIIGTLFAEMQVREITRGIQSAQATGGQLSGLSSSYQNFLDEVRPIKDAVTNTMAFALSGLLYDIKLIVHYAKYLEYLPGVQVLVAAARAMEGTQARDQTFFDVFQRGWQTGELSYRSTRPGPIGP